MRTCDILLVTRNLPPLIGGMERLNWHIADQLSKNNRVHVIGPSGAGHSAPANIQIDEMPLRPLGWFLITSMVRALIVAYPKKPRIIMAGSGLTAPIVWFVARLTRARSVVYLHGLDIVVDQPIYQKIWLPMIRRMDRVIVNSQATRHLAERAGIATQRLYVVPPGVEVLSGTPNKVEAIQRFRKQQNIESGPVLLSVGRLTARKGILEFVRDVLPGVVAQNPGTTLLIVGEPPDQALNSEKQTPYQIRVIADSLGVGDNIRFIGNVSDEELDTIYRSTDVHVFPVQDKPNDPEGFGMVAIEAAAYGIPTIAYATGGVVDAIADGESGYLIEPNHVDDMIERITHTVAHPMDAEKTRRHAERYDWNRIGSELNAKLGV